MKNKIFLLLVVGIIVIAGCTQYTVTSQDTPTTKDVSREGKGTLIVRMSGVSFIPSEISVKQEHLIWYAQFMHHQWLDRYLHLEQILIMDRDVYGKG